MLRITRPIPILVKIHQSTAQYFKNKKHEETTQALEEETKRKHNKTKEETTQALEEETKRKTNQNKAKR